MLSFEVGTTNGLDAIERKLAERNALIWHAQTETYKGIMGVDPDRTEIAVASSLTGTPITADDWKNVDDTIYRGRSEGVSVSSTRAVVQNKH